MSALSLFGILLAFPVTLLLHVALAPRLANALGALVVLGTGWHAYVRFGAATGAGMVVALLLTLALANAASRIAGKRREALARQVAALQARERELVSDQRRLDLLVRAALVGIVDWEGRTHATYYSPRFREILGHAGDADTSDWPDYFKVLIHPDDRERVTKRWRSFIVEKDPARRQEYYAPEEYRLLRADGSYVWVQVSGVAVRDANGFVTRWIATVTEITDRKRAEEMLLNVNAELEQRVTERTAALQTAYRELEAFSYSVSHDLRSPLGVIASFAGLLARQEAGRISEDGMRLVSIIDQNAQRMAYLIDALLDLMRVSRRTLVLRDLDMHEIAAGTCRDLQREYPAARIEIGALPRARGDETLVQQVYANLVGNALKFSSRSPAPRVEIGAETIDGVPAYFVRDNGVGFDNAYETKLFRPFERLHAEHDFPGTGIGLALVQLIVQRHGGRVWAESVPGSGATFRFTLTAAAES